MTDLGKSPQSFLWDAVDALEHAAKFTDGRTLADYRGDRQLRRAVERELEIAGESLSNLRRVAPDLAGRIPALARVVGLRNILAHGYAVVDDEIVWIAAMREAPILEALLRRLLGDIDPSK